LSPRGDHIEIVDPVLQGLGFKNVEYHMNKKDRSAIDCTLSIGKYAYSVQLTSDLKLAAGATGLTLPEAGSFIEHVILAHLTEILCTDNVGEVTDEGDLVEARKAFSARRAHKRVLPNGQKPSREQVIFALNTYGIDIPQRNRARTSAGEVSLITWVRHVEAAALAGKGAVVSKAPAAMNRLNAILNAQ
jgi:hypothetical protein